MDFVNAWDADVLTGWYWDGYSLDVYGQPVYKFGPPPRKTPCPTCGASVCPKCGSSNYLPPQRPVYRVPQTTDGGA